MAALGSFDASTSTLTNFANDVSGQANEFWLPEIFSKKILVAFRKASVAEAITNTDYYGEISAYGDTVKIIKEPQLSVADYTRGATLSSTALTDEELTLSIDVAKYWQFEVDDLEKSLSHVNWQQIAADNAGYKMKDAFDSDVLAGMFTGSTTNIVGDDGVGAADSNLDSTNPVDLLGSDGTGVDPADLLGRMARLLDDENVPQEQRFFVAKPEFYEQLAKTSAKLMSADYNQGNGGLRNGLVMSGQVRGFDLYVSNNIAATTNATGKCLAGAKASTATATAMSETESFRSTTSFNDTVRGLQVWGKKVLRPEGLVTAYYTID